MYEDSDDEYSYAEDLIDGLKNFPDEGIKLVMLAGMFEHARFLIENNDPDVKYKFDPNVK